MSTIEPTPPAAPVDADRRADWLEIVELLLVLLAAVVYIYVIGWVISWVRLSTARVPVDASLPTLDNQAFRRLPAGQNQDSVQ